MSAKIIPMVCPKCGGAINFTDKGPGVYKCPYCDTPIYFDDGVKRSEHTENINTVTRDETEISRIEAEDRQDQREKEEYKYGLKFSLVFFLIFVAVISLLMKFG